MLGVAADVDCSAVLKPSIQLCAVFANPVLYVDLAALITRERGIKTSQVSLLEVPLPLKLIEEIAIEVAISKEQPIITFCALLTSLPLPLPLPLSFPG